MACLKTRIHERLKSLIPSSSDPLFEAARYSLLSSGKRLRPLLAIAAAETFGAGPEMSLDPACAIEMIHTYSLIHDDLPCMDDDELRRGKPTLHKVYSEGMALLTGDYLLTYAFEVLAKAALLSPEVKLRLIQILSVSAGARGMIGGQAIDISSVGEQIDAETLLKMHEAKTGALLAAALQFGAVIGGAPHSLEKLGKEIGLAFQFLDDLLDATSNREFLGKNVQRDALLKKPTAVACFGIDGVKEKLEAFECSINARLLALPGGALLIAELLEENLWARSQHLANK